MKICVICTGNELLKGAVVNTNLAYIGDRLTGIGMPPYECLVVPDSPEDMTRAFNAALQEADVIVTSGGLGPTRDDMTRDIVCEALGLNMIMDPELEAMLRIRWAQFHPDREPPEELFNQAMRPAESVVMENKVGTASGLWIEGEWHGTKKYVALLPGPPVELEPMVDQSLVFHLKSLPENPKHTLGVMLAGIPELMTQLQLEKKLQPLVDIAYCATPAGVKVYVSSVDMDKVHEAEKIIRDKYPDNALPTGCFSISQDVFRLLKEKGLSFVTAESCTGGMIAAEMTSYSGSSDFFLGGVVAYANAVKRDILNVPEAVLETKGAVSAECVRYMVENVAAKFNADTAVAVSGIAGPGGGTQEKPVGLVYIGAKVGDRVEVGQYNFRGGRDMVRMRTVAEAYLLLRKLLLSV